MKQLLKEQYRRIKSFLTYSKNKNEVIEFKKNIWQTNEVSTSFIKGTDARQVIAADLMDKEVNEFFLAQCTKGDRVLDIGCGHGIVSVFLARNGMVVTGVDISEKLLDEFRSSIVGQQLNIEIKQGDAYNIPAENGYFDVVVARMFLPHFPDWPKILYEIARVTRPGGKIIVHFSSKENTELGKKIGTLECRFATSPDVRDPWSFYAETDDAELQKVAADIGLELQSRTPVSFFLHNRIIGYQLGSDQYNRYMEAIQNYLEDEKVRDFVLWFDRSVIAKCTPALSHFNILSFKKI